MCLVLFLCDHLPYSQRAVDATSRLFLCFSSFFSRFSLFVVGSFSRSRAPVASHSPTPPTNHVLPRSRDGTSGRGKQRHSTDSGRGRERRQRTERRVRTNRPAPARLQRWKSGGRWRCSPSIATAVLATAPSIQRVVGGAQGHLWTCAVCISVSSDVGWIC